jgi:hemolysin activation/secretion protein
MRGRKVSLAALLFAAASAFGQTVILPPAADPGAIQQRQMEEERLRRETEREQRRPAAEPLQRNVPEAPAVQPGPEAVRFMVREIRFTPSELLSADELEAIARDFRGRELDFAGLRQLVARVNELYRSKGIVTAQAVLPPQDVTSGVVLIKLVEGRMGKARVEGNDSTRESYVTDRLGLKPEDLMDLAKLEAALIRFNRTNEAQVRAELAPGERFGTTDLKVVMTEPPRQDLRLTLDNLGSSSTGYMREGISYLNRSLFGYRDDLNLSYTNAQGQDSRAVSYGFPVNSWGGRVNVGYYKDTTAIVKGPLVSLRITGESVADVISFRQPTLVDAFKQIDIVGGGKQRQTDNWIDGVLLQHTETSDVNLGLEAQIFGARDTWFASYVRYLGAAKTPEREAYRIDRGALRYLRDLDHGLSFHGALSWQSTRQVLLPSSEQFFIGGEGSVRGYPVGLYSGDTGQTVSLELHHPLLAASAETGGIGATGFFFVDYGRVKPFRPPHSSLDDSEALTGLGWGLNASLGKRVTARVTFGYGTSDVPMLARSYQTTIQLIGSVF